MTDEKKPPEPAQDVDWDEALAEWDTKNFVPVVAPEILHSSKEAEPRPGSRRLYRPPPSVAPVSGPPETRKAKTPPPAPPPIPEVELDPFGDFRDEQSTIPAEEELPAPAHDAAQSVPPASPAVPSDTLRPPTPPPLASSWDAERPANGWFDETAMAAMAARATWLEAEARAMQIPGARARAMFICSELLATLGERERAHALAVEARSLAPTLALVHHQARALMPWPPDPDDYLESADAEAKASAPGPARTHALLLAADALHATGDDAGVAERIDEAFRIAPGDVRVVLAKATRSLLGGGAMTLPTPSTRELAGIRAAIEACHDIRDPQPHASAAPPSSNAPLVRARRALEARNLSDAVAAVGLLRDLPGLDVGTRWLQASIAGASPSLRSHAAELLDELVLDGEADARRALLARALELEDAERVARVAASGALQPEERLVLSALIGSPSETSERDYAEASRSPGMRAVACAAVAVTDGPGTTRARKVAGDREAAGPVRLGRLLSAGAPDDVLAAALSETSDALSTKRGVALELAKRSNHFDALSEVIEAWSRSLGSPAERANGALVAAMIAEVGRAPDRAREAFQAALDADPTCESAIRALASQASTDLPKALASLADSCGDGARAAMARVEGALRLGADPEAPQWIRHAMEAAPDLPLASFVGELMARRAGDAAEAVLCLRERRSRAEDPIESAVLSIREALAIFPHDPHGATERLLEAHQARPSDVALRELYERVAVTPPDDRAAWAIVRAASARGDTQAVLSLEAAYENEREGHHEQAFMLATTAAQSGALLARTVLQRAEIRTDRLGRLTDEWLQLAKTSADPAERREACEHLAALDAWTRHDDASALLWHRSILEDFAEHKPSLRFVEHQYIGAGRHEDLEPVAAGISLSLRSAADPECAAHAVLAGRLRRRAAPESRQAAREMIDLAQVDGMPTLWSLRQSMALGREVGDDGMLLAAARQLVERASRPNDRAVLLVRVGEAAASMGNLGEAGDAFERAAKQDPGDVSTLRSLAVTKNWMGDARAAAQAHEALARSSAVESHRLRAWYDAGSIWATSGIDRDRAITALETAAAIDPDFEDVFDKLASQYGELEMHAELAELLRHKIDRLEIPEERRALEVRRGRVLTEIGDLPAARASFETALGTRPDDIDALSALADLCVAQSDWEAAEQALVRLGRLLPLPADQRQVYEQLGELYANHLLNFPRAEVALKEVLKRSPDDLETARKLVDIFRRQGDAPRAIEMQQELVVRATTPEDKRSRALELAALQEDVARDPRSAEKTLEAARRELPADLVLLRAMVSFYQRHKQSPAIKILLDRVANDARRAIAGGQMSAALFDLIPAVLELRGRPHAATSARAVLAAVEGRRVDLPAAVERAFDPQLDEIVAPEALGSAMRALLARAGDALDAAAPVNLRDLRAAPMRPDAAVCRLAARVATATGLNGLQVYSSPKLGAVCLPVGSSPPAIVLGEAATADERICMFLAIRALKLVRTRASTFARLPQGDLSVLLAGWLKCFNPGWQPAWVPAAALQQAVARVRAGLPRTIDPNVGALALEVTGTLQAQPQGLGLAATTWANRVALLALGDPMSALDAIAGSSGSGPAPREPRARAAWVAGSPEARDIVVFGVSDALAQAHARLGVDR